MIYDKCNIELTVKKSIIGKLFFPIHLTAMLLPLMIYVL